MFNSPCSIPCSIFSTVPCSLYTFDLDFNPANPPLAPIDSDGDGMPDSFEIANAAFGLNPSSNDANGSALSVPFTGIAGYTNLECYLNQLADQLLDGESIYANGFE